MAERTSPTPDKQPGDGPTLVPSGEAPTAALAGGAAFASGAGRMSDVLPADDRGPSAIDVGSSGNPAAAKGADAASNLVGRTIGRYEIVRQLGRGGMGVVYLARDPLLDRPAAVKLLVEGELASAEAVARFQREAQAIARIQHPNIAQVYESGTADGRPYLAMEYLAGGTLAERTEGRPQRPLEAAAIVETLARAMQAAHEKDVVHRDLKPGNVLAAADGTLKICDFGLAKRLDVADGQTATGAILGSPSYMAPEQAGGVVKNVGPACDVYSLGAVLYELLTGRPPFFAPDAMQTVLMVLSEEPVSIRRLQPQVPRDLSTICRKCLEKSARRRYESAAALADDLHRFRNGLPIAARPVRSWERAARWARRRPAAAGLLAVSVLAATTLVVGGAWYNAQLRTTNEQLQDQLRRSNQLVVEGDDLAQWVLGDHISEIGRLRGGTAAQKQLVDRLRTYLTGLSANANDRDPLLRTIARSWYRLAEVQGEADSFNLGDTTGALASAEAAERLYLKALEVEPDDAELRLALANCRRTLIHLRTALGRPQQEEAELRRIADDLRGLESSGQIEPDRLQAVESLVRSDLGWSLRMAGRTAEAAEELRRALATAERLTRAPPDGEKHEATAESIRLNLAQTLEQSGAYEEAAGQTEKLTRYYERQAAAHPTDARIARNQAIALETHGDVLVQLKRPDEASAAYRQAEALLRGAAEDDPDNAMLRSDLAGLADRSAAMLMLRQDYAGAKEVLDAAAAEHGRLEKLAPANLDYRRRSALLAGSLGECLSGLKQWDAAIREFDRGAKIGRELTTEDPSRHFDRTRLAETYLLLGLAYFSRGVERMSEDDVRQALETYRRSAAEFAEVDRNAPLGPKERKNYENARQLAQLTEQTLQQLSAPPSPSTPPASAGPATGKTQPPARPTASATGTPAGATTGSPTTRPSATAGSTPSTVAPRP